jgi:hypothetical protein
MKYVFALFVSYPLALLYSLLPYGNAKHVFNVVAGITLAQVSSSHMALHNRTLHRATGFENLVFE